MEGRKDDSLHDRVHSERVEERGSGGVCALPRNAKAAHLLFQEFVGWSSFNAFETFLKPL